MSQTQEFTQKDLIHHLLDVTQHTATREELAKVEISLNNKIDKLDLKIDKVEANLNKKIDKLDLKIDKVEANLNNKIDKLDLKIDRVENKLDRMQWIIVSLIIISFFKEQIMALVS